MHTLTLVFNERKNKVLVCVNERGVINYVGGKIERGVINYVGGKIEESENLEDASYRELQKETGITKEDIDLKFLMQETVSLYTGECWSLYITAGILKHPVTLVEKNKLFWWNIGDVMVLGKNEYGGDLLAYMQRARMMLRF